jgi:hypothetical protein
MPSKYGLHLAVLTDAALDRVIDADDLSKTLAQLNRAEFQDVERYAHWSYGDALLLGALHGESFMIERSMIINWNLSQIRQAREFLNLVVAEALSRLGKVVA